MRSRRVVLRSGLKYDLALEAIRLAINLKTSVSSLTGESRCPDSDRTWIPASLLRRCEEQVAGKTRLCQCRLKGYAHQATKAMPVPFQGLWRDRFLGDLPTVGWTTP